MDEKEVHINATYHIVGGTDKHELTDRFKRWTNFPKKNIVTRVPLQLDLELSSACDLECPMCFHAEPGTKPHIENMPLDFYLSVIDEFATKRGDSIKLNYRGEPLITKDLHDRVAYALEKGLDVRFNTNGRLLDPERSRKLIEVGRPDRTYQIIFSIDSHIPEEYNKIRKPNRETPGDFNRVIENLRTMRKIRDELGVQYPQIRVTRVDLPETRESLPAFKDFCLANGADFVSVVDLNDWSMGKEGPITVSNDFCCEQPWQRMFILAGGDVTQCCGDEYQKYPLAHLATPSKMKIYESILKSKLNKQKPGEVIEAILVSSEKLERDLIGRVQEDNSVKPYAMRIRGIAGNIDKVPITNSVEEAWLSARSNYIREANRSGVSHLMPSCADCGYRNTVIKNNNLESKLEPREKAIWERTAKITYIEKGLDNYEGIKRKRE